MKLERVLLKGTIFLVFIGCTESLYWQSGVPIVFDDDCNPRCDIGQHCMYDPITQRPSCNCPNGKYYVENQGCQKLFDCPLYVSVNPWGTLKEVEIRTTKGVEKKCYFKCNEGFYSDPERIICRKANLCDLKILKCSEGTKCVGIENKPTKEIKSVCVVDKRYKKRPDKEEVLTCAQGGKDRCVSPAMCYDVKNDNSNQSYVCGCPEGMYLTRNRRQCSTIQEFKDNKLYSINVKDADKTYPNKFKVFLDGCFNIEMNKGNGNNTLTYQSVDTIAPITTNFNTVENFKSIHFEMKSKTLNILIGNEKLVPIFSIKFEREKCNFIESLEGLEEGNNIIATESIMRDHPTL